MKGAYPNLYLEEKFNKQTKETSTVLGWTTRQKSKSLAFSDLKEDYAEGLIKAVSRTLLLQMAGFWYDPTARQWRQDYKDPKSRLFNDDGIMAFSIANQMRKVETSNRYCAMPEEAEW
jgi:hypothetical protein